MASIHEMLKTAVESGASDLHVSTGIPPMLRIDGVMRAIEHPILMPNDTKQLCYSLLTEARGIQPAAAGLGDAVIINTCAVTGEAVRQARQAIRGTADAYCAGGAVQSAHPAQQAS